MLENTKELPTYKKNDANKFESTWKCCINNWKWTERFQWILQMIQEDWKWRSCSLSLRIEALVLVIKLRDEFKEINLSEYVAWRNYRKLVNEDKIAEVPFLKFEDHFLKTESWEEKVTHFFFTKLIFTVEI